VRIPLPEPAEGELVIDVLAAGLHPRVLSQANGSHYTSTDELPLVPGIDGVGRDADGNLRYFILPDTTLGAMAEQTIIDARLGQAAADVDIDYLWGEPATAAMIAVVTDRTDRGKPLSWVQIGSVAGLTADIPSAALRAARLQIVGSGQGSVPTRDILAELPQIAEAIASGSFTIDTEAVALAEVEQAWGRAYGSNRRIVITSQA